MTVGENACNNAQCNSQSCWVMDYAAEVIVKIVFLRRLIHHHIVWIN